jgi:hypothetical protein
MLRNRFYAELCSLVVQRGGQSGGLVTLLPSHDGQVRGLQERVCPTKRQHLAALVRQAPRPEGSAHLVISRGCDASVPTLSEGVPECTIRCLPGPAATRMSGTAVLFFTGLGMPHLLCASCCLTQFSSPASWRPALVVACGGPVCGSGSGGWRAGGPLVGAVLGRQPPGCASSWATPASPPPASPACGRATPTR